MKSIVGSCLLTCDPRFHLTRPNKILKECSPTQKLKFSKFSCIMDVFCVSHAQMCISFGVTLMDCLLEAYVSTYRIVQVRVQHTRRMSTPMCSCIDVLIIKMVRFFAVTH